MRQEVVPSAMQRSAKAHQSHDLRLAFGGFETTHRPYVNIGKFGQTFLSHAFRGPDAPEVITKLFQQCQFGLLHRIVTLQKPLD